MTYEKYVQASEVTSPAETPSSRADNNPLVAELVAALAPHPAGLRRWSVMRAIRKNRAAASRDIPLKLEADIERTFRQYCSSPMDAEMRKVPGDQALFYRPKEKAGEVWALHPQAAQQRAG